MRHGMLRIGLVLAAAVALTAASVHAPALMRRIDAFAVQQVEVTGTRYLQPSDVVAAAGITARSNIFDEPAHWLDALLHHPLVRHAEIERRVPGTLRIAIREARPVAFARTPELRPIDERGMVLPADAGAEGMDLPVLLVATRVSGEGRAADLQTRRIAAFLGDVSRYEPGLLGWISEVGLHGDAIRLVLRSAADADVLLPAEPGPARLRELHLTLADLAMPRFAAPAPTGELDDATAAAGPAGPELSRVRRIDGRYHDQIVVALHRGKN